MRNVEVISDTGRFRALADEWDELLSESVSPVPFLSWEWMYAWWRHLGGDRELHIITVRDGERLVALAPLTLRPARFRRLQPFRLLEFLGSGLVGSDYLDIIVRRGDEPTALAALARHLRSEGRMLELIRLTPSDSCASGMARHLAAHDWVAVEERIETCPYLELDGHDWESYLKTLGGSHRYNVRRRFRKLSQAFDVEFEECTSEESRAEALDELVRLHRLRHDTLAGSDALHTRELVAFHHAFSALALARGWLRLYLLKLDGQAVASVYGLRYRDVFYFYQSGFDPSFNKFSVGLVVLGYSIRRAIDEGVAEYDLLHGDEEYKFRWTSKQRPLARLTLYPPGGQGRLARWLAEVKETVKGVRRGADEDKRCRAA